MLDMSSELYNLQGQIRIDIQHSIIIMSHHPHSIFRHSEGNVRRSYPVENFVPCFYIIQRTGNLMKRNSRTMKNVSNLRYSNSLTVRQPFASHFASVPQTIEPIIVNGTNRLQI